jgi:hypothetical protein
VQLVPAYPTPQVQTIWPELTLQMAFWEQLLSWQVGSTTQALPSAW